MTAQYSLPPKADDVMIRRLARWLLHDLVLTVGCVPENLLQMVFMPVTFGAFRGWSAEDLDKVVVFAVYGMDDSGSQMVNGFPMFTQCRIWPKEDFAAAMALAAKAHAALNEILGPESNAPIRDLKAGLVMKDQPSGRSGS